MSAMSEVMAGALMCLVYGMCANSSMIMKQKNANQTVVKEAAARRVGLYQKSGKRGSLSALGVRRVFHLRPPGPERLDEASP